MQIFLASSSHTRRRLLDEAGIVHRIITHNFDERSVDERNFLGKIEQLATYLAQQKALYADVPKDSAYSLILAADTIVYDEDQRIFHKPTSYQEAFNMLSLYSNATISVATGLAIGLFNPIEKTINLADSTTTVTKISLALTPSFIYHYLETYKDVYQYVAGGLIIEGFGAQAIKKIDGSYTGALGLPMAETKDFINQFVITKDI